MFSIILFSATYANLAGGEGGIRTLGVSLLISQLQGLRVQNVSTKRATASQATKPRPLYAERAFRMTPTAGRAKLNRCSRLLFAMKCYISYADSCVSNHYPTRAA